MCQLWYILYNNLLQVTQLMISEYRNSTRETLYKIVSSQQQCTTWKVSHSKCTWAPNTLWEYMVTKRVYNVIGDIDFYANTVCYDVHCATDSLLNRGVIVIWILLHLKSNYVGSSSCSQIAYFHWYPSISFLHPLVYCCFGMVYFWVLQLRKQETPISYCFCVGKLPPYL